MFIFKKKKNPYWLRYNKWNFFFSDSIFWFSKKMKIKNNFFLTKKRINFNAFFYYKKNQLPLFKNEVYTLNILFKLYASLTGGDMSFNNFLFISFLNQKIKMLFLFKYAHFYLNYKNTFVRSNACFTSIFEKPINHVRRKVFLNFNENWQNTQSLRNTPARLVYKINYSIFSNYKLVRLFYKTRKFGFFPLSPLEIRNGARTYVTKTFPNCSKFFIFKNKKTLFVKIKNTFIAEHENFFFLSLRARYYFLMSQKKKTKSLQKYFLTINKKSNKIAFSKFYSIYSSSRVGALFNIKKLAFFNNKIWPFTSNMEFFFTQNLSPLIFKIFTFENLFFVKIRSMHMFASFLNFHFNNFFFYSKTAPTAVFNNIIAQASSFTFMFKKFIIRTFSNRKFPIDENSFHYETIIRFLEFCSGKKIFARFNPFMTNLLTLEEKIRCAIWSQKIKSFRKVLGPRLFLNESLQIIYFCLKNKDVYVLSSWMLQMFYKISFWKYKLLFRYMQYILRYFFWAYFESLKLTGLKFQMKGKISVAGNARTRKVLTKIGTAGHASFKNRILYDLKLIRTFTGVIGFKTWIFF